MVDADKKKTAEERKMARLLVTNLVSHIDEVAKNSSPASKQFLCGLCYKHYRDLANKGVETKN